MTFLDPLDALIPKISFSFFSDFWVWVTSEARGSVSLGFSGSCQLSPFFWGGVRPEGSIDPPSPPRNENPASPAARVVPRRAGGCAGASGCVRPLYHRFSETPAVCRGCGGVGA